MNIKISEKRAVNSLLGQMDNKVNPTFQSNPRILHLADYDPSNVTLDELIEVDQIDAMVVSISQSLDLTNEVLDCLVKHCERLSIPELLVVNHNPVIKQSDLDKDLKIKVRILYNEPFEIKGLKCFMLSSDSQLYRNSEDIKAEVVFGLNPPLNCLDDSGPKFRSKVYGCPRLAEWLKMRSINAYCFGGTIKGYNDNYIKLSGIHYFNSSLDYQIIDFDTLNKIDRFSDVFKSFRY